MVRQVRHATVLHPAQIPPLGHPNRPQAAMATKHLTQIFRSSLLFVVTLVCVFGLTGCATHSETGVRKTSTTFTCVVLDAGHGGHDSGARSRKGLLEKEITLDVVRRLAPKLQAAGLRTVLTRNTDVFIPLDKRVEISEREHSAVFLSVHFNDTSRRQISGMESYYFSEESRRFSQRLVTTLARVTGAPDRGSRVARFRVLRCNLNPAVLVECGYLSNRNESALLADARYREKIAVALADAVVKQRGGPVRPPGQPSAMPQNAAALGQANPTGPISSLGFPGALPSPRPETL
jgi:N-acetylmuramoyl-L-alanine amidase